MFQLAQAGEQEYGVRRVRHLRSALSTVPRRTAVLERHAAAFERRRDAVAHRGDQQDPARKL